MVDTLSMVVVVYSILYVLFTLILAYGELRMKPRTLPDELPRVSVVLCARNEEQIIRRCLDSLAALDYPPDRIELIVVDDESTDRTLDIYRQYAQKDARFRVFSTAGEPRTLIGKQRPLSFGIRESTGEIILGVDADMAMRPGWVKAHVAAYHEGVGVVGGTTRVVPLDGGMFAKLQACDLTAKISVAMGCAGLGIPLTIMGNNISFRRDAYASFGGFERMKPRIVEDLALMNAITRDSGYRLGWTSGIDGVADSTPETKLSTFIEQRRRWLNELGDMSFVGKFMLGYEIVMNLVFLFALFLMPFSLKPVLVATVCWLGGYGILLASNPGATLRDFLLVPCMMLFQIYYGLIIMHRNLFGKKIIWKGREYAR